MSANDRPQAAGESGRGSAGSNSAGPDPMADAICQALDALSPIHLRLRDDSGLHVGHPGAQSGGGHYHIEIESERFAGKTLVARHRQVYAALGPLMGSAIHALAIQAWAPGERQD